MALAAEKSSLCPSVPVIDEILLDLLSFGDTEKAARPGYERLEALKRDLQLCLQSRLDKSRITDACDPIRVYEYDCDADVAEEEGLVYSQFFTGGCEHAERVIAGKEIPIGLVVSVLDVCPYHQKGWSLNSANVFEVIQVLVNFGIFDDSCPIDRFNPRISPTQLREFYAGCIATLSEKLGTYCYG